MRFGLLPLMALILPAGIVAVGARHGLDTLVLTLPMALWMLLLIRGLEKASEPGPHLLALACAFVVCSAIMMSLGRNWPRRGLDLFMLVPAALVVWTCGARLGRRAISPAPSPAPGRTAPPTAGRPR